MSSNVAGQGRSVVNAGGACSGVGAEELVAAAADAILAQCAAFVERLPDGSYAVDSQTLKGGTCGKHVRHVLDHFNAVFLGADTDEPITYDRRERNVPMETSRVAALATITELRSRLAPAKRPSLDRPVRVRVMVAGDGTEAELQSSLCRELAFATHHAVHHQAMLKAIAGEFGVEIGAEFGRAPSTLHFERVVKG